MKSYGNSAPLEGARCIELDNKLNREVAFKVLRRRFRRMTSVCEGSNSKHKPPAPATRSGVELTTAAWTRPRVSVSLIESLDGCEVVCGGWCQPFGGFL